MFKTRIRSCALLIGTCAALLTGPARADLEAGLAAFAAQDYTTARRELMPLAEAGDAQALFTLSWMYRGGNGVQQDLMEAVRLLQQAADQNHPEAQSELATFMFYGIGMPPDVIGGMDMLERSAGAGVASAQQKLGAIYVQGVYSPTIPINIEVGERYLNLAAEQNYAPAMHSLGEFNYYGKRDYIAAADWFTKAAETGLPDSMFFLAHMHMNGEFLAQDPVKAYMWGYLAQQLGNNNGELLLMQIAETITANDIFRAEGMANECRAKEFKGC